MCTTYCVYKVETKTGKIGIVKILFSLDTCDMSYLCTLTYYAWSSTNTFALVGNVCSALHLLCNTGVTYSRFGNTKCII